MFFTLILLLSPTVRCCNLYNDFCDNMESGSVSDVVRVRRQAMVSGAMVNMTRDDVARHVSQTLDTLFGSGYNKQLRPGTEGRPTIVEVNIAIR